MRKFTATLFLLATLSLGCLAFGAAPVLADENVGTFTVMSEHGPFTYSLYMYPATDGNFFFYPGSYVQFNSRNGKYWMIEAPRFNTSLQTSASGGRDLMGIRSRTHDAIENFNVTFHSPDGKLLGRLNDVDVNTPLSFPRDGKDYEYVVVRMESHSAQNFDVRFVVWEPVGATIAEPIK